MSRFAPERLRFAPGIDSATCLEPPKAIELPKADEVPALPDVGTSSTAPKPEFPWSSGTELVESSNKRKAEEIPDQEPSPKRPKLSPLDKLLQNQKDFQVLMAKQQHAFQQQLMQMLGNNAIKE